MPRTERFEARLTTKQKNLVQDAARLFGETLSEFVVSAAEARARGVLLDDQLTTLTNADRAALVAALSEPRKPNRALKTAWRRYQTGMAD